MQLNVVIIEPSSAGVKLIDASLSLNHKVYLLTHNKQDRVIPTHYLNQCEVIQVDTNDELAMQNKLRALHSKMPIHAILPGFEYYVPASARLNSQFGLHGLPPETVESMRLKHKMRQRLLSCGVKMPWFVVVKSLEDLKNYTDKICFPCVIKPSHLAGSLHIIKVNDHNELENYLSRLLNDQFIDLGHQMAGHILIEEYISGRELSVEGYINNGAINFVSITDKFLSEEPHFVEIAHIVRAHITVEDEKSLLNYTSSVVKALGISLGPFHCEIRITNQGPVLIEIAARLPGDNISELIELATNISLAKKMVKGYLGNSLQVCDLSRFKQYAGVKFIYSKDLADSVFSHIEGIENIKKIPGFHRFGLLIKPGERIYPFADYRARIAEVIFTGSTHDVVKSKLALADSILQVKSKS